MKYLLAFLPCYCKEVGKVQSKNAAYNNFKQLLPFLKGNILKNKLLPVKSLRGESRLSHFFTISLSLGGGGGIRVEPQYFQERLDFRVH
jgi:hypothetical protein